MPSCMNAGDDELHRRRPAPYGGPRSPRCATCEREFKRASKRKAKASRVERVYSTSAEESAAVLAFQGGKCAICQRATGASKNLAHDHDHACCPGPTSCGKCLRGRLCSSCNQMIGRCGLACLIRAARYLLEPPWQKWRDQQKGRLP